MGVNQIGTFYRPHQMSEEENRLFTDTIGRMGYMLDGGVHESNVAVYYPIEGIYIDTLPPAHLNRFNDKVRSTSANFSDLVRTLVGNQIDYDILDAVNLAACEVEEGALVTPSGRAVQGRSSFPAPRRWKTPPCKNSPRLPRAAFR